MYWPMKGVYFLFCFVVVVVVLGGGCQGIFIDSRMKLFESCRVQFRGLPCS